MLSTLVCHFGPFSYELTQRGAPPDRVRLPILGPPDQQSEHQANVVLTFVRRRQLTRSRWLYVWDGNARSLLGTALRLPRPA